MGVSAAVVSRRATWLESEISGTPHTLRPPEMTEEEVGMGEWSRTNSVLRVPHTVRDPCIVWSESLPNTGDL